MSHTNSEAAVCPAPQVLQRLSPQDVTRLIREGAADGGWQGFAQRIHDAIVELNQLSR